MNLESPRISIVTAVYNQAKFLEETIQSVLSQDYQNLEYIIIDGGSTDGTVDIIRKYSDHLAFWVSEPDNGLGDASAKGFEHATGDIFGWLNSDDIYLPGTLKRVAEVFEDRKVELVYGGVRVIDEDGRPLHDYCVDVGDLHAAMLYARWTPCQEATFWRRELYFRCGEINKTMHYAADYDFFLRASALTKARFINEVLTCYRRHKGQLSKNLFNHLQARDTAWLRFAQANGISRLRLFLGSLYYIPKVRYAIEG